MDSAKKPFFLIGGLLKHSHTVYVEIIAFCGLAPKKRKEIFVGF